MSSALKPVLPQPGVQSAGGQPSPAKANVASGNNLGGALPGAGSLVGQNLTAPTAAPPPQPLSHAAPSMAPVSANMAQMAQNMSHHGNLSHVTQNSVAPPVPVASPVKVAVAAAAPAPLSLVQDKPVAPAPSQPLALTRTPEKKEPDSTGQPLQANGNVDQPKPASNAPASLKPQNSETNKDKLDIAKTSPSTPKPPEKPSSVPSTPQKAEAANSVVQAADPAQPKVATANEAPEKSPSKPTEPKPAPTADVAPTQSDNKPVPESAKDSQGPEKAPTPQKQGSSIIENAKVEVPAKVEEKKIEPEKPAPKPVETKPEEPKVEKAEPKKEEKPVEKVEKVEEKVDEKKPENKTPAKTDVKGASKPTLKLATVTPPMRKRRQVSPSKSTDGPTPAKKPVEGGAGDTPDPRSKRNRTKVQLYQSPTPELAMATKLSASAGRSTPTKPNDDKLIVFYKNEYLAVRNAEGGFYVCQAMQNVYRTTRKIKIRWLSQDKTADPSGETYKPDFYDVTDMECVLTTLSLTRAAGGGGAQILKPAEQARAKSILDRALKAEQSGDPKNVEVTEEHPDGLDLSLYTDESQLEKKSRKRAHSKSSPRKSDSNDNAKESATPVKKARTMPKRSPKSAQLSKPTPTKPTNKRKSAGTTPIVASASKTATAVSEKAKAKSTPKRTAKKPETLAPSPATPARGRRAAARDSKPSPIVPTPSTSTGKTTRTPRKPPAKK